MTEWVPTFDYPGEEWLLVDVTVPDGAERAAQQVADRGGRRNKRYAKDVYPELKSMWQDMLSDGAEPLVVYVPQVRRNADILSPATVNALRRVTDYERTLEAVAEAARLPLSDPSVTRVHEPEITTVELGAGPARVYDATLSDTGFRGEQLAMESVDYHVLAPVYPDEPRNRTVPSWTA